MLDRLNSSSSFNWVYLVEVSVEVDQNMTHRQVDELVAGVRRLRPLRARPSDGRWLITLLLPAKTAKAARRFVVEELHGIPGAAVTTIAARRAGTDELAALLARRPAPAGAG